MLRIIHTILVLLLSLGPMKSTGADTVRSNWPHICVKFCSQLDRCKYPADLTNYLTVHMMKITGVNLSSQGDTFRLGMKQRSVFVARTCGPIIASHRGQNSANSSRIKLMNNKRGKNQCQKLSDLSQTNKTAFPLKTPAVLIKQGCDVLSMTLSKTYPCVLYLLLQCMRPTRCYRFLYFVDLKSQRLLKHSVHFCEKQEGDRQIFTGPCQVDEDITCLYSVNNGYKLYITTYIEPAVTTKRLMIEITRHIRNIKSRSFVCSITKSKDLLCLHQGEEFYHVNLNPGSNRLTPQHIVFNFQRFLDVQDFKLNDNTSKTDAIIVQRSLVTVVEIDFEKKGLYEKKSFRENAVTASLSDDDILLHGKKVNEPFYMCRADNLTSCLDQQRR